MGLDIRCLYTCIKNTSGEAKTFSFLPPHGRHLDANELFYIFGELGAALSGFDRSAAHRKIVAFENSLVAGDLTIVHSPQPVLLDDSNPGSTKMVRLRNGTLGVTNPCWTTSTSVEQPVG